MEASIILLHGLFGGLSNWTKVTDHFKKHFNVFVPVLPLYEKYEGDTLDYLTVFLEKMITAHNLKNVILIGNSLGGHMAIHYTHKHPDNVAKLILTGSSGLYENTQFGSFLKRSNYAYIKGRVAATFFDPGVATDELVAEVMQVTTDVAKCLSIIKAAKSTQRSNILYLLPSIKIPTLLIWGKEDQITPLAVAWQFKEHLPNSKLIVLPNCGHAPMMELPGEFNLTTEQFLLDLHPSK